MRKDATPYKIADPTRWQWVATMIDISEAGTALVAILTITPPH